MTNLRLVNSKQYLRESAHWDEDIDEQQKRTFLRWLYLYIAVLFITVCVFIYSASAQTTEDAVFQAGPNTDSPDIVDLGGPNISELPDSNIGYTPTERIDISKLIVDSSHGTDTAIIAGQETLKQKQDLHEAQLKAQMKLGKIPAQAIRNLKTPRFAPGTSEIEIYKLTITFHQKAIVDGLPLSAYIDWINQGHPNSAKWIRDALNCGTGFEIYPDSGLCSEFPDHITSEQHGYHRKLHNFQLAQRNGELEAKCGYGAPKEKPCADLGWNPINIWKPQADGRPNEAVVVLDKKYCNGSGQSSVSNFRVEDALGGQSANVYFRECDDGNGGRLHMGIKPQGSKIQGPVFVRYTFNGVEECRRVNNPANRED